MASITAVRYTYCTTLRKKKPRQRFKANERSALETLTNHREGNSEGVSVSIFKISK
jgi:hypothetical protein